MIDPLDSHVDGTLDPRPGPVSLSEHVTVHLPRRTVPTAPGSHHTLSPTQLAVRSTITRYGMASSSQLRRLHYPLGNRGSYVRCADHLLKLTKRGFIHRLPYSLNSEYVYAPQDSKARIPNLHTLDITELYVSLVDNHIDGMFELVFDPEPWAHRSIGGYKVTPDAYVVVGEDEFFVEVDRSSESPATIAAKMNRYVNAYKNLDKKKVPVFPLVVWLAHDLDRVRTQQREANKKMPDLFECALFSQALEVLGP